MDFAGSNELNRTDPLGVGGAKLFVAERHRQDLSPAVTLSMEVVNRLPSQCQLIHRRGHAPGTCIELTAQITQRRSTRIIQRLRRRRNFGRRHIRRQTHLNFRPADPREREKIGRVPLVQVFQQQRECRDTCGQHDFHNRVRRTVALKRLEHCNRVIAKPNPHSATGGNPPRHHAALARPYPAPESATDQHGTMAKCRKIQLIAIIGELNERKWPGRTGHLAPWQRLAQSLAAWQIARINPPVAEPVINTLRHRTRHARI